MPPSRNSNDELSLRHFPDVSDTSFSFQIPGTTQEINLLADDGLDFFNGVDLSRGAPQISPPRANTGPLSINDLTPRLMPDAGDAGYLQGMSSPAHQAFKNAKPKQEKITTRLQRPELTKLRTKVMSNLRPVTPSLAHLPPAEGTSSSTQMTKLRADIDSLSDELHVSPLSTIDQEPTAMVNHGLKGARDTSLEKNLIPYSNRRGEKPPRNKQKVIEGGITKSRATSKAADVRSPVHTVKPVEQESSGFPSYHIPAASVGLDGDDSVTDMSMGPGSGVAGRLVKYGQNLINSFGVYHTPLSLGTNDLPSVELQITPKADTAENIAPTNSSDDTDGPLTLSQVSPRKRVETPPTPPANASTSPRRSAGKRPASVASGSLPRKKSRTGAPPAANTASASDATLAAPAVRTRAKPTREVSKASSYRVPAEIESLPRKTRVHATGGKASTPRGSRLSEDGATVMTKSASTSSSVSSSRSTRILRATRPQGDETKRANLTASSKGKAKAASTSKLPERPAFEVRPLDTAKPTLLQSSTESWLLTRKERQRNVEAEASSQSQPQREKRYRHPIPDFKAMHAAQEAKLALLKENIHPTLPQPIILETDRRVLERQKFDDMVKEKQREQERLMEEKRREREEEEERELRELRKKTIPKAHTVPEWYKEAPRKKDKHVDGI